MGAIKYLVILLFFFHSCDKNSPNDKGTDFTTNPLKLRSYVEEIKVNQMLLKLSGLKPKPIAIINGTLIEPQNGEVINDGTVLIEDERIVYSGSNDNNILLDKYEVIDAENKYVIPGLVDMHVHTAYRNDQKLLNLINGVTSVREMAGQQWMIGVRENIRNSRLMAPNLYIASNMLNHYSLGMHTTVVKSKKDVEKAISEFENIGYNYIKIWNNIPNNLFDTIITEAERHNLKVVGHIPMNVNIADALAGMYTLEHFKGYVSNNNQEITDENYVELTNKYQPWLCPTFYTTNVGLSGAVADSMIKRSEESKYVSPFELEKWEESKKINDKLPKNSPYIKQARNMKIVFQNLNTVNPRYLAGTDSGGGFSFLVPGFGLHDELKTFNELGMTPLETLQTATSNAAKGLLREGKLGTLKEGARADFLILNANPLEKITHLKSIDEVIIRGIRLDNKQISSIKEFLTKLYDKNNTLYKDEKDGVKILVDFYKKNRSPSFSKPHILKEIANDLKASGFYQEAAVIEQNI